MKKSRWKIATTRTFLSTKKDTKFEHITTATNNIFARVCSNTVKYIQQMLHTIDLNIWSSRQFLYN